MHIVHTEASCGWGGQEIRILTESKGMMARGHQVTIISPEEAPIHAAAIKRGIPAVALPIGRKKFKGVFALKRWLKQNKVDLINTHSSTDSWLASLACALMGAAPPIVRSRHISAPIPNNGPTRWLYETAACHVVTTGEKLRQTLIHDNGYLPDHITSVPTGIDTAEFYPGDQAQARAELGLASDGFIIGIVATLRSWKGHEYLLEALAALQRPDLRLLIIGHGPQHENLQQRIAELGLQEQVMMPGNQDCVRPWLQAMDLFVLPSYANEGVPQSILQAMLCGLPVISTPVGSIEEAVQHQHTGLIVPAKDSTALQHAISQLIDQPALRQQYGQAALNHAQEHFTLERMVDKMERIFRAECR